jgi:hypothetical protein
VHVPQRRSVYQASITRSCAIPRIVTSWFQSLTVTSPTSTRRPNKLRRVAMRSRLPVKRVSAALRAPWRHTSQPGCRAQRGCRSGRPRATRARRAQPRRRMATMSRPCALYRAPLPLAQARNQGEQGSRGTTRAGSLASLVVSPTSSALPRPTAHAVAMTRLRAKVGGRTLARELQMGAVVAGCSSSFPLHVVGLRRRLRPGCCEYCDISEHTAAAGGTKA